MQTDPVSDTYTDPVYPASPSTLMTNARVHALEHECAALHSTLEAVLDRVRILEAAKHLLPPADGTSGSEVSYVSYNTLSDVNTSPTRLHIRICRSTRRL